MRTHDYMALPHAQGGAERPVPVPA
jgi:hypothetical protein